MSGSTMAGTGTHQHASGRDTVIYFVRHTDVHNPGDVLYGRLPRFGLSSLGREQAERTASALAGIDLSAVYSSPQLRARQTARTIAQYHPTTPVKVSSLLNEVLTSWQGSPNSELDPFHFDFYSNPLEETDESLEALWNRTQRFVTRVRKMHSGQAVCAVTHGDVVFLARSIFRGMPLEVASIRMRDFYPGKGSITRLTFPCDLGGPLPASVDYYDPNSDDAQWSSGWVSLHSMDRAPAVLDPA